MNNINKYILLIPVFLLTGCPGPMDRMMSREYTTAIIKNNQVCVISPLQPNQRIIAVEINSNKSNILREIFIKNPIYVAKGECLPLLNITPQPGLQYSISWNISVPNADAYLVTSHFSITKDHAGTLQIH